MAQYRGQGTGSRDTNATLLTGFEPQRHAMVVEGRPVMVVISVQSNNTVPGSLDTRTPYFFKTNPEPTILLFLFLKRITQEIWGNVLLRQVLVLTHERASFEERCPYLAVKWYPMPILNVHGRCATLDPETRRDNSV